MSEKQYPTGYFDDPNLVDCYVECDGEYVNASDVAKLLNKLSEENKKLKHKVNGLKSELTIWKEDTNEHIQETNKLFEENEQIKKEFSKLKHRHSLLHDVCIEAECDRDSYHKDVVSLEKENEQLKKELTKFKEWEKYVGDVKREELDRVFKMSVYEIAEGFQYYQERIKELETVIQQILYETRANHPKGEYSIIVSVSPQMHDKLSNLIMKRMW